MFRLLGVLEARDSLYRLTNSRNDSRVSVIIQLFEQLCTSRYRQSLKENFLVRFRCISKKDSLEK